MSLRGVCALVRVGLCVSVLGMCLSGCARPGGMSGETASIGATLVRLATSADDDARATREEAIIAQAIAAHEMRNP